DRRGVRPRVAALAAGPPGPVRLVDLRRGPHLPGSHAIGAPRRRVAEEEVALPALDDEEDDAARLVPAASANGQWHPPAPRGAVRVRLLGEHGVADLTGPTACEVISPQEKIGRAAWRAREGR